MLYVIDNVRAYEAHRLWLVETDLQPERVAELLKGIGPKYEEKEWPHVILMTDVLTWAKYEQRMAFFDCDIWRLIDPEVSSWDDAEETHLRALMNSALREESESMLHTFKTATYGRKEIGPGGSYCINDSTVPDRAVRELNRRTLRCLTGEP